MALSVSVHRNVLRGGQTHLSSDRLLVVPLHPNLDYPFPDIDDGEDDPISEAQDKRKPHVKRVLVLDAIRAVVSHFGVQAQRLDCQSRSGLLKWDGLCHIELSVPFLCSFCFHIVLNYI